MNKATITLPDGGTAEVELSAIALPQGYQMLAPNAAPAGYVKQEVMDAKIAERLERQKGSLKSDPAFARDVFSAHGIPVGDDGKPALPKPGKEVDVEALRGQFTKELVDPIKVEAEKLKAQNARLLDAKRRSEIISSAVKHGVREDLLKPIASVPGAPSFWENMIGGQYGYVEQTDSFALRDGDGFAINPNGTGQAPYLDIDAHVASLKKDSAYAGFFKVEGQKGSGFQQNGNAAPAGQVTREMLSTGKLSAEQLEGVAKGTIKVV